MTIAKTLEGLRTCIHCGMCLTACPTYVVTGLEPESPRGRIHLMQALLEERAPVDAGTLVHLDRCLACRACETVCPAGVPYGALIESTRALVERAPARRGVLRRIARWLAFRWLLPHPTRIDRLARVLALYERSGLRRLLRRVGLWRALPRGLRMAEGLLPSLVRPRLSIAEGGSLPARDGARMRAALLTGCVMRVAYGDVHEATARLLSRAGVEVRVPAGQVCCGALHAHAGDQQGARDLARANVAAFERGNADVVVVDAAGCGAHMKHYGELLAEDREWASRARAVAAKVRDVTEVLADVIERVPLAPLPLRVTYQDPCHLAHAQGIRAEPRALLRRIPGLELVEMREADRCCGSAGIYNLLQPDYAARVLDAKMADVAAARPQAIATANPGCMLQLRYGAEEARLDAPVYHVVELLERAARAAEGA